MSKSKSESSRFIHLLSDITVNAEDCAKLFDVKDKILNENSYANCICDVLKKEFGCTFNIRDTKSGKNSVMIYTYCKVNANKQISLKCFRNEIQPAKSVSFQVRTNSEEKCIHQVQEIRNLSKDKRKELQEKLKHSTTSKVCT
jgi:hypothetical protein